MKQKLVRFSLKDQLFHLEKVNYLASLIQKVYLQFNKNQFENEVMSKFPELELMERISWIRINLEKHLPSDYKLAIEILLNSLPQNLSKEDFIFSPYSEFVSVYGCEKKYLKISFFALGEFTKRFSAEYAIREFINKFPDESFDQMKIWSKSNNIYQRRLSSEGFRPKLPWGKSINFDYKKAVELLNNLYYDSERYVTRSVANHLNDISKVNSNFVIEILKKWKLSKKQKPDEMKYIIHHSLRTLIKKGNKYALEFLDLNTKPKIVISEFKIQKLKIQIGENLSFSFKINSKENEKLIVDYIITYPMKSKKLSQKVFKIKKLEMKKGQVLGFVKNHPMRLMTTKNLNAGNYKLELQVNGSVYKSLGFKIEIRKVRVEVEVPS